MKKIIIQIEEGPLDGTKLVGYGPFNVIYENKRALGITYDEMLGLISAITMPEMRPCLNWLKTKQEITRFNKLMLKLSKRAKKITDEK